MNDQPERKRKVVIDQIESQSQPAKAEEKAFELPHVCQNIHKWRQVQETHY